jgi:uncharacterized Zn finger protein (UPF0148 family)
MQRKGSGWTDREVQFVLEHTEMTPAELSEELPGRTVVAVRQMRNKLKRGYSPHLKGWTADDDDFLIASAGVIGHKVMASHLGKPETTVRSRLRWLKEVGRIPGTVGAALHPYLTDPNVIGGRTLLAKTCPACGLLLDRSRFNWSKRSWSTVCMACGSKKRRFDYPEEERIRTKAHQKRLQSASMEHAVRSGQRWTEQDVKIISDPDLTLFEKALKTGRSYNSVLYAIRLNGLSKDRSEVGVWIIEFPNAEGG